MELMRLSIKLQRIVGACQVGNGPVDILEPAEYQTLCRRIKLTIPSTGMVYMDNGRLKGAVPADSWLRQSPKTGMAVIHEVAELGILADDPNIVELTKDLPTGFYPHSPRIGTQAIAAEMVLDPSTLLISLQYRFRPARTVVQPFSEESSLAGPVRETLFNRVMRQAELEEMIYPEYFGVRASNGIIRGLPLITRRFSR